MTGRILVMDDTPANVQALAATLKAEGYQISVATNGMQALEAVRRVSPDLILDVNERNHIPLTTARNLPGTLHPAKAREAKL